MHGYTFPDGLLVDLSPRVRLYIPVQYLYQLVRYDVVVDLLKIG